MRRGRRDEAAKCPGKCRDAPDLRESEAAAACRRRLPRGAGRQARERSWRGERRRSAREPREQSLQAGRKRPRRREPGRCGSASESNEGPEGTDERGERNEVWVTGADVMMAAGEEMAELVGQQDGEQGDGEGEACT